MLHMKVLNGGEEISLAEPARTQSAQVYVFSDFLALRAFQDRDQPPPRLIMFTFPAVTCFLSA